jgi:hypothetical protein
MKSPFSKLDGQRKEIIIDATLIVAGGALSGVIIGSTGEGQGGLQVLRGILQLLVLVGLVSSLIAWLLRRNVIAVLASISVNIIAVALFAVWPIAYRATDRYVAEMGPLIVIISVVYALPVIVLSTIGCVRLVNSAFRQRDIRRDILSKSTRGASQSTDDAT